MSKPSPLNMPQRKPNLAVELPKQEPANNYPGYVVNYPGHVVRPAVVTDEFTHDGVIKAKHAKPGQVVRPFLHGKPVGRERTIKSVEILGEDRSSVWIEFEGEFEAQNYKPAYRWYVAALVGTPVKRQRAGFEVVR